jgi:hypothetical protein
LYDSNLNEFSGLSLIHGESISRAVIDGSIYYIKITPNTLFSYCGNFKIGFNSSTTAP